MTFADDVHEYIAGTAGTPTSGEQQAADAVAAWLIGARPDIEVTPDLAPANVKQGCLILAARLVSRRGTPTGAAPGYDGAGAVIARVDPDVQRLTGTGRARKPGTVG